MTQPLVTIVTPSYNSGKTISGTIESILNQTYPNIEYIIMDGGSTDDTAQTVTQYQHDPRLTFISEPDNGQSDAINKGWRRANGEVVAWLCADDYYLPHTVQTAVDYLTVHSDAGWVYGHDQYTNTDGDIIPFNHEVMPWDYEKVLSQELYLSQPTTFWRKKIIDEFGYLREDLDWGMDMEYYLRIGRKYPGHMLTEKMATITWTRETKTFQGGKKRLLEIQSVSEQYGGGTLAKSLHVEWVEAYLTDGFKALGRGNFGHAIQEFGGAMQFGGYVPKGFAKLMIRTFLSEQMESRLRQILLRK